MVFQPFGAGVLAKVADTGINGFALVNGTPTIISWTAPNDGNLHPFVITGGTHVTVAETGGAVHGAWTLPDSTNASAGTDSGGRAPGGFGWTSQSGVIGPGQTVIVSQSSALTAGAATVWAQIYGA